MQGSKKDKISLVAWANATDPCKGCPYSDEEVCNKPCEKVLEMWREANE